MRTTQFLVAQLGARMHYAVPRILAGAGQLDRLCTDFVADEWMRRLVRSVPRALRPQLVERALGRTPPGIPREKIASFKLLAWRYSKKLRESRTQEEKLRAYLWAGKALCDVAIQNGLNDGAGVYTFNSAGLELLRAACEQGAPAVLEQTIAPMKVERALLAKEVARFPDWECSEAPGSVTEAFIQREAAEWNAANLIVCGSEFVRKGIIESGGPAEKCRVIPYGVVLQTVAPRQGDNAYKGQRPLHVLTAGAVGLRKGSPYVLEAAKRLKGHAEFRSVGNIAVSDHARSQLSKAVQLTGAVPRAAMGEHYSWADILLLPSICEGSATVVYEALAHGVPAICTPNAGSVIRDGVEGFIVAASDSEQIVSRLEQIICTPKLLASLQIAALARSREFSLEAYAARLLNILNN